MQNVDDAHMPQVSQALGGNGRQSAPQTRSLKPSPQVPRFLRVYGRFQSFFKAAQSSDQGSHALRALVCCASAKEFHPNIQETVAEDSVVFALQTIIWYHLRLSEASQESKFELAYICGATRFHIEVGACLVNGAIAHFWGNWPE